MGRPPKLENWLIEAAELMARTGCTLKLAVDELGQSVTSDECDAILRRASFLRLLWESRHRYFSALSNDPNWKKDTAVGKLMNLAQRLEDTGEFDKAAEVVFKAAKMSGWVGPESTVSVFGELSQRDLDALKEAVAKEKLTAKLSERVN